MRLRTALTMIGVSFLTPGCQLAWDATTNIAFETCLFTDTMTSKVHYCLQANEAWKEYLSQHGDGDYCADFAKGFKTGYQEYLEGGGGVSAPPTPPMKYWKSRYQNAEGRAAAHMWSLGYREGASAAKASGARKFIEVPFNKPTPPPPGFAKGIPGLPPGATVLPPGHPALVPQVPEMELPAPRPAPARDGKTASRTSVAPPDRRTPGNAVASPAPHQPESDSDSVPLQPIRSILSKKRKPAPLTPAIAPREPAKGNPGSPPGATLPPPGNPSLVPPLLPPAKLDMLPPPPPPVSLVPPPPVGVAPPHDNKTSSASDAAPRDHHGTKDSVSARAGHKVDDTAPMQPLQSILSEKPTPPASSPAVAPPKPAMGTFDSLPGATLLTPGHSSSAPKLSPAAAKIDLSACRPAACRGRGAARQQDGRSEPGSASGWPGAG